MLKSFTDRYEKIAASDWFKEAYHGKSLSVEQLEDLKDIANSQQDIDAEVTDLVDTHFWDLI